MRYDSFLPKRNNFAVLDNGMKLMRGEAYPWHRPYNIAATKQLELIDDQKNQYDDKSRLEMREERLRQVEENWYQPITNKDVTGNAQEPQPSIVAHTNFGLDQNSRSSSSRSTSTTPRLRKRPTS